MSSITESKKTFSLYSKDLGGQFDKNQEFNGFGGNGNNISPQLFWENAPKETKSFAITMYDSDAPTGSGWWHWLAFNIPSNMKELVSNAGNIDKNLVPENVIQSINDYGTKGYGGPCPPIGHGFHQYTITIHALKVEKLDLDSETNAAIVGFNLWANSLAKASLVSYYKRD